MSNEWYSMHAKTINNCLLEIERFKARNTLDSKDLNLSNISFVITGLRNELIRNIGKLQDNDTEIKELKKQLNEKPATIVMKDGIAIPIEDSKLSNEEK